MRNPPHVNRATRTSYLLVLAAAVCCYAALGAVVRIAPHYVRTGLGGPTFVIGLAIGAPAFSAVFARPLGGRIADTHGTRVVVVCGSAAMALTSAPLFIHDLLVFVGARLLVGIGEGAMMAASVLWLLRLAGPERRGRALGHIGLANYAGLTAGPLLADVLGDGAHVDRVFALAVVLPLLPLALLARAQTGPAPERPDDAHGFVTLLRLILRPGVGLLLINIGYAALLSFGTDASAARAAFVLPAYALTVIAVRTFAGGVPDRFGGRATLALAAPTAAAGLVIAAFAPGSALALLGIVVLGIGQGPAVPALGLLALEPVPPAQHGAASGVFFAWFDAGVGLGGPLAGALAAAGGGDAALTGAAAAVALAAPVAAARWRRS